MPADINFAVIRAAMNTGGGTQDFTSAGFGTPKAAIFLMAGGITDGTAKDHALMCVGATDGTNQWVCAGSDLHNFSSVLSDRRAATDECIMLIGNTGAIDIEANFDSWVTDGVRVNLTNAGQAYLLTVILINGADVSVKCDTLVGHATVDTAVTYSSMGFEADLLWPVCGINAAFGDVANLDDYQMSIGAVHNDRASTITQAAHSMYSNDGPTTSDLGGSLRDTRGYNGDTTSAGWLAEFGNFGASGFDMTSRVAGAGGAAVGFLGLRFDNDGNSKVQVVDTPTSTGSDSVTGTGTTPIFAAEILSQHSAVNTIDTASLGGVQGIWVADGTNEFTNCVASEDGVGTSNTQSINDNTGTLTDHTGTLTHVQSFTSFDSDGYTRNFTTTNGTARKWISIAVMDTTAAAEISHYPLVWNE